MSDGGVELSAEQALLALRQRMIDYDVPEDLWPHWLKEDPPVMPTLVNHQRFSCSLG